MRKKQKNNNTGYSGVCISYTMSGDGRIKYPVVRAYVEKNKKKHTQNFYLKNYLSVAEAILSAAMWRVNREIELEREDVKI